MLVTRGGWCGGILFVPEGTRLFYYAGDRQYLQQSSRGLLTMDVPKVEKEFGLKEIIILGDSMMIIRVTVH
jgi:hypothetical protein